MHETKLFSADDPQLTAYALGELEGAERATVEAALRDDPAARAVVAEIRATASVLGAALASEPLPVSEPVNEQPSLAKAAIIAGRDPRKLDGGPLWPAGGKLIRFPQFYYVVGAAAAGFALIFALNGPGGKKTPTAKMTEPAAKTVAVQPPAVPPATKATEFPAIELKREGELTSTTGTVAAVIPVVLAPTSAPAPTATTVSAPTITPENEPAAEVAVAAVTPMSVPTVVLPEPVKAKPPVIGAVVATVDVASLKPEVTRSLTLGGTPTKTLSHGAMAPAAVEQLAPTPLPAASATVTTTTTNGMVAGGDVLVLSQFSVSAPEKPGLLKRLFGGAKPARPDPSATMLGAVAVADSKGLALRAPAGLEGEELRRTRTANTESYASSRDNEFLGAAENPLSTFSVDVDTASYSNVRRFLTGHQLPPADAVRIEELVNYFPYRYAGPKDDVPFATSLEVADAPWAPTHRLVRIGLKGREIATAARPAANLVFLLDVSGSMNAPNRLPLVKESLRLLVGKLRADDRVAIVTYAGQSGLALASTPAARSREILEALDSLEARGSTNGGMGIVLAYDIAKANLVAGGINRVILCTDGDFNVGVTSQGALVRLIEEKAKSGVFLTVLGFGMGNLKDSTLELLADKGNGQYGYIDSRREAEKLFVDQLSGTLVTIAKDVKIQVDFNPAKVASYRLIGYENRMLKKEDFNNDLVDAGEVGAGHTVTALYEIVPVGAEKNPDGEISPVEESKYIARSRPSLGQSASQKAKAASSLETELLTVRIRYKQPDGQTSRKLEFPLTDTKERFAHASADFRFVAAVAGFGMILRDSPHRGSATFATVIDWAEGASADDAGGYRSEFIGLAKEAEKLTEAR